MRTTASAIVAVSIVISIGARSASAQQVGPVAGPATTVDVPLCRILDTRLTASASATIDVPKTRCGQLVPPNARAYILRTVSFDSKLPEQAKTPPFISVNNVTVPVDRRLNFTAPGGRYIAVDLAGYVVPDGTVVPSAQFSATPGAAGVAAPRSDAESSSFAPSSDSRRIVPKDVVAGSAGTLRLDGQQPGYTYSGVFMKASPATPWIAAQTVTTDANSGVIFYNSANAELMRVNGAGSLSMPANGYYNGRSDFFGYYYSATPGNVVHNVILNEPHDASNGATQRVVLFNATTTDEYTSPATTCTPPPPSVSTGSRTSTSTLRSGITMSGNITSAPILPPSQKTPSM